METIRLQKIIRSLLWVMFTAAIITIGIAWGFYPETYDFFREAVSALGGVVSTEGFPNPDSKMIMTIGFITTGTLGFVGGIIYFFSKKLEFHMVKGMFLILMGAGAMGIGIPYNKYNLIHYAGAFSFLLFFGIYNLTAQVFRFIRKHDRKTPTKNFDYYLDLIMVIVFFLLLIFYLVTEVLESTNNLHSAVLCGPLAQKMVLIGIGITTFLLDLDDI